MPTHARHELQADANIDNAPEDSKVVLNEIEMLKKRLDSLEKRLKPDTKPHSQNSLQKAVLPNYFPITMPRPSEDKFDTFTGFAKLPIEIRVSNPLRGRVQGLLTR